MKKALVILTIALIALSFSQAASALTIDLAFDGYCDGMHINIIPGTGLVDGNRTGDCVDPAPIHGTVGNVLFQGTAVTVASDDGDRFVSVIRQNGTWSLYVNDGGGIYEWNAGTWSYGVPDSVDGVAASTE